MLRVIQVGDKKCKLILNNIVTDYFPTVHVDTPIMDMLFKFHAY